jgi:tetratricopeptide (TPR) repeat protein
MSSSVIDQLVARQQKAIKDFEAGRAARAVAAGRRNIADARRELGERHPLLEELLGSVGKMHQATGALADAEALFAERVRIRRTVGGSTDPQLVAPLMELSEVRLGLGNRSAAQQLAEEALSVCRANAGEDAAGLARPLNVVASMYLATGQPRAALRAVDEALDLTADADGRDAKALRVECLLTRGRAAEAALDLDLAEQAFEAAAKEAADLFGRAGPAAIVCHGHLGRVKQKAGDLPAADRHHERAAALAGEYVGVKSPEYAQRVAALAECRAAAGNLPEFLRLMAEAGRIVRAALGGDSPTYAGFLGEWPDVLDAAGRVADGAKLRDRALAVAAAAPGATESDRVLGLASRAAALSVRSVAEAEAAMAHVLALLSADPNADPRGRVRVRAGRTIMLARLGRLDEVEAAAAGLLRELRIHEWAETAAEVMAQAALAQVLRERGKADQAVAAGLAALEAARARCGTRHPMTIESYDGLTTLYGAAGRWADAVRHARRYAAARLAVQRHVRRVRPGEASTDVHGLPLSASEAISAALAGHAAASAAGLGQGGADGGAGGAATDLAAAAFASASVARVTAFDALAPSDLAGAVAGPAAAALRRASAALREATDGDPPDGETADFALQVDALADAADAAEAVVVAESPRVAARVRAAGGIDVDAVRRAIPADALLVCYVRYVPADFGGSAVGSGGRPYWQPPRYAVFVVTPREADASGAASATTAAAAAAVTLLDLGPAAAVDAAAAEVVTATDSAAADAAGRRLAALVFAPVAKLAGARRRLLVVPDGELARVPLDALPWDGAGAANAAGGSGTPSVDRRVFDDWRVDLLSCPGDLLPLPPPPAEADPAAHVLFADPPLDQDVRAIDAVAIPDPAVPRTPAAVRRAGKWAGATLGRLAAVSRLDGVGRRLGLDRLGRAGGPGRPVDLTTVLPPTLWPATSVDLPAAVTPVAAAAAMSGGGGGSIRMPASLAANERRGPACTDGALTAVRSPRVLVVDAPWFALRQEPDDPSDRRVGPVAPARVPRPRYGAEVESPLVRAGVATAGFAAAAREAAAGRWVDAAEDGVVTARDVYGMDLASTDLVVLSRPAALAAADGAAAGRPVAAGDDAYGDTVGTFLRAWVAAGAAGVAVRLPLASAGGRPSGRAAGGAASAAPAGVAQSLLDAYAGGRPPAAALRAARQAARAADPADRQWMGWSFYATAATA